MIALKEIPFDELTPITAYLALAKKGSCLLESAPEMGTETGTAARYSSIGIDPIARLSAKENQIEERIGDTVRRFEGDPYQALRELQKKMRVSFDHPLASFTGGAVGFIAYDAVRLKEKIPSRHPDLFQIPDFFFQFYRTTVVFDHLLHRAVIAIIGGTDEELEALCIKLQDSKPARQDERRRAAIETDLTDEEYAKIVGQAQEHIRAGDIFQIVPSRTFSAKIDVEPIQIYRSLRQKSPAPFLFFFDLEGFAIAGASPEKIISVQDGIVESVPIAGTQPLSEKVEELMSDPKENAEHVMLVDLARNDLGAVCVPGTIEVTEFKQVRDFAKVRHIVSRVRGKLKKEFDALDAFKASFPAGTLSGAPKVRAMELIDALETSRRGIYGGAILSLDAKGNLMSCIAIRTALIKEGVAYVRAGGGVVLDSNPLKEAAETRHKANTVLEAL